MNHKPQNPYLLGKDKCFHLLTNAEDSVSFSSRVWGAHTVFMKLQERPSWAQRTCPNATVTGEEIKYGKRQLPPRNKTVCKRFLMNTENKRHWT